MDAPNDLNGPGSEWAKRLFLCMADLPMIYAQIQWHRVDPPNHPYQKLIVAHFVETEAYYDPGMDAGLADIEHVTIRVHVVKSSKPGERGGKTLFYYFGVTQDGKHAYFTPDPLIKESA